ncbi:replication initiation protein [Niallia endozanthoxylica]|uniref:Replication initiation protein n=1 Tax=Niallia endozanthoxylica TaxID=2036016 RepID=A0A5J5HQ18_9BACI|nr:replication initiation protein [Niallia endozanthoxylica]KAA9021554.1 replication initiation protein [Niallia endozanthoxylica]
MLPTELIEVNRNNFVTKSNRLIEANYKLGVVEQKIILCLASNIQPTDSDFKTYTLPIKEFTNLLGLRGTPKYTELRKITKELMQKVFEIRINKKVIQVAWLSYVAYNESEGTIDIRFDPFLRPYLLELKREFTSYKLENVVKLKSSYAIRIYELLKQYEKIQERTFLLSDLRELLGAENIYPAYGNFKQRVLLPAQKELKNKTDISFKLEEIKNGRRVAKVKFIIQSVKQNKAEKLSLFEENLEEFKSANSLINQVKKLGLRMGVQLTNEVIHSWEKYGIDNVLLLMGEIQDREDIDNPIGYITTVLKTLKAHKESHPEDVQNQMILPYLVSYFSKSKEPMSDWFIAERAIEKLQVHYSMELDEATAKFEEIKEELFKALGVAGYTISKSKEERIQQQQEIEELLKQLQLSK